MEFKGTKGNWETNPRALRNIRCNGITVANCSSGQNGDKEEEEIANAKLIASAPEMFDMLKLILNERVSNHYFKIQQLLTKITKNDN